MATETATEEQVEQKLTPAERAKARRAELVVFAHQRPNGTWFINEYGQSWGLTEQKAMRFDTYEEAEAWAKEMGYDFKGKRDPLYGSYDAYPGRKGDAKRARLAAEQGERDVAPQPTPPEQPAPEGEGQQFDQAQEESKEKGKRRRSREVPTPTAVNE